MSDRPTTPDASTREAEKAEAERAPTPGDAGIPDDAEAAERARQDPELTGDLDQVGRHVEEMNRRGASQEGEGRIR
jgi:hypothetical protein